MSADNVNFVVGLAPKDLAASIRFSNACVTLAKAQAAYRAEASEKNLAVLQAAHNDLKITLAACAQGWL